MSVAFFVSAALLACFCFLTLIVVSFLSFPGLLASVRAGRFGVLGCSVRRRRRRRVALAARENEAATLETGDTTATDSHGSQSDGSNDNDSGSEAEEVDEEEAEAEALAAAAAAAAAGASNDHSCVDFLCDEPEGETATLSLTAQARAFFLFLICLRRLHSLAAVLPPTFLYSSHILFLYSFSCS